MSKVIIGAVMLLCYLFPTGILASGLVTEIAVSGKLVYSDFYKTKSFIFILAYTFLYIIIGLVIYVFKEKLSQTIDNVINGLFERGQLKNLKNDIEEIKSKLDNEVNQLPKVIHGTCNFGKTICVLTPSPLFIFGSITSIYYYENEYERLIGLGRVSNIQENLKIQVEVIKVLDIDVNQSIFDSISNNDNTKLSKIIIKPNVSLDYLSEINY